MKTRFFQCVGLAVLFVGGMASGILLTKINFSKFADKIIDDIRNDDEPIM